MSLSLQSGRTAAGGRKFVLLAALVAALLIAVSLAVWIRTASPAGPAAAAVQDLLQPGNPEFAEYRPQVTLEIQKLTLARNFAGNRMVMVSAVVHNGTDRWLEAMQVRVTLRNGSHTVAQQTRLPLAPGSSAKPVAPQEDFAFTTRLEQIPSEWMGDRADVEISGLKFSRSRK